MAAVLLRKADALQAVARSLTREQAGRLLAPLCRDGAAFVRAADAQEDAGHRIWQPVINKLLGCSPDLQLLAQGGATTPVSALADKVVGLYFSAHWCPPCHGFTPKLTEVYTVIKGTDKSLEIVFVSSFRHMSSARSTSDGRGPVTRKGSG